MPYRIIRAPQNEKPAEDSEGIASYINRNILTPAVRSLSGTMGGIPGRNYGEELAEKFVPGIVEKTGGAPKGLASEKEADIIPGTLASFAVPAAQAKAAGGKIADIGRSLAGSLVGGEALSRGAEALGAPEKVQQIAGIAGTIGGGAYARQFGLKKPSSVLSRKAFENKKIERPKKIADLEKKQKELYQKSSEAYRNIDVDASELSKALSNIEDQASIGVDVADQKRIFHTMDQARDLIRGRKVNVQKAIDFVQNRNRAVYDQNMPPVVKKYNQQLINDLNKLIDKAGSEHPKIGEAYSEAKRVTTELKELQKEHKAQEKLTYAQYEKELANKTLGEWIGEGIKFAKGELLPATLSAIAGYFGGKETAGIALGTLRAGKMIKGEIKNIKAILKENPGLAKELVELERAAVKQDKSLATAVINKINDRFKKKEEKNKEQRGRWRIIRSPQ